MQSKDNLLSLGKARSSCVRGHMAADESETKANEAQVQERHLSPQALLPCCFFRVLAGQCARAKERDDDNDPCHNAHERCVSFEVPRVMVSADE